VQYVPVTKPAEEEALLPIEGDSFRIRRERDDESSRFASTKQPAGDAWCNCRGLAVSLPNHLHQHMVRLLMSQEIVAQFSIDSHKEFFPER
jgi:hypothetical protein